MNFSRVSGAVFGAAIGDALGSSFEGSLSDSSRMPRMKGGGMFSLAPGAVTDDTYMMLALLETWTENRTFVRDAFLKKVTEAVRNDPKTFGRTTQKMASFLEQGCSAPGAAQAVDRIFGSRTNGSVMRTLPVGLVAGSIEEADTCAREVSCFTHLSFEAQDACAAVSRVIYLLISGHTKEDALSTVPVRYLTGPLTPSVDAFESSRCAFSIFRDGTDFSDVIKRACCLGGDTDTIAAIAGGMAGALYGLSSIPHEWQNGLLVRDRIQQQLTLLQKIRFPV